jgi:hypothetical protein
MWKLRKIRVLHIAPTDVCLAEYCLSARYFEDEINNLMKSDELSLYDIQKLCPTD